VGRADSPNVSNPNAGDALAVLTGTWGANQTASIVVADIAPTGNGYSEVEVHLRTNPATGQGYEITWGYNHQYLLIATWFKAGYSILAQVNGPQYGISPGDRLTASISGNVISMYTNGQLVLRYIDTTNAFTSGNPGFGFNEGSADNYGISSFSASSP
jgi:hypothetical protein